MLPTCGVISFLLLTCVTNSQSQVPIYHNQLAEAVHIVKSVQGGAAKLPCDVTPSFPGDKAYIVIWYKEDQNGKLSPIYTFDSRDTILLGQGKHWSAELGLGDRADFRFQEEPAKLAIDSVLYSDAGVYQCRVDFKQSPTRNSRVNLTVIIPPRKLSILDENGVQVANYVLGPYNEGFSINLTCIATGGFPTPKVTWWQENALLDDSCEDLSENSVRNILHMEKLQRRHLGTVLTCQASNNDLIAPISTSMRLDLNLQPLSVKIEGENKPLSAGKLYQFKCEVVGSNPSPKISWWRGRNRMDDVEETRSKDGNITTSLVTFIPTLEDEGKYITCSAKQPLIRDSTLESRWKLSILHRPVVSLGLGNLVKSTKLREGDDAYFDCKIKSNPWVYKISWRYNGKTLFSNTSEGIIISNQSLVLQEVDRNSGGSYTCVGSNQEGDGESNSIELEIQFAPVCRSRQVVTYELSVHQTATINCDLDASPKATDFVWIFNNTGNFDNPARVSRTTGTISYSPQSESNYGTLFCKGINGIGEQDEPCIFQIVRAASSPVKFHITPALAITMSVVAIVVVIFVVLLAANRLCNGRRHDCKEYDEDGLSRIRSNDSIVDDKNEMRSKSSNIEEDKNPDIIPTDEKAIFEHLSSETYLNLQDTDDISTSYVTSPDFSNLKKQPKSRQMEFSDRDLSYTEAILQRSSGYYPLRLERLPVYKSEKFRYATKPVPGAARLQPEQSDATLQPLILHRDRIPVMILPRQKLTVTQL